MEEKRLYVNSKPPSCHLACGLSALASVGLIHQPGHFAMTKLAILPQVDLKIILSGGLILLCQRLSLQEGSVGASVFQESEENRIAGAGANGTGAYWMFSIMLMSAS